MPLNSPREALIVLKRMSGAPTLRMRSWVGIPAGVRALRNSEGYKTVLSGSQRCRTWSFRGARMTRPEGFRMLFSSGKTAALISPDRG